MLQSILIENGVPLPSDREPTEPKFPTIKALCDRWDCSRSHLWQLAKRGEITIFYLGFGQSGARVAGVKEFEERRIAGAKARSAALQVKG